MKNAKAILVLLAVLALGTYSWLVDDGLLEPEQSGVAPAPPLHAITDAYDRRLTDVQVEGRGVVSRILPDDREGSRHQRFVLRLPNGQTLLVAHNIDIAPRINALREGDSVSFYGEYKWNEKGGVIHWTHHDPDGRHVAGWLKHEGRTYQ
jgi:hypothetical protein